MTSETDGRGLQVTRIYNNYGQLAQAELPDGTIRTALAGRLVGFVPAGQGTATNPARSHVPLMLKVRLRMVRGKQPSTIQVVLGS